VTVQKDYAQLLYVFVIQQMERMEIKAALQLDIKVIHIYEIIADHTVLVKLLLKSVSY